MPGIPDPIARRAALALLGGLGLAAVAAACSGGSSKPAARAPSPSTSPGGSPATSAGDVACVLAPEVTAGPYYLAGGQVRSDITEGRPGTPLALAMTVVDATTCTPIKRAAVDIWHADAHGVYSGFANASTGGPGGGGTPTDGHRFLRGVQMTDARGRVQFATIYPGWYQGRAVHIHVEVRIDNTLVHTGQFFFPEALTAKVFATGAYAARGAPDTRNRDDSIFTGAGGATATLDPKAAGSGYRAAITTGVRTA